MSHTDDSDSVSEGARNDISESVLLSYVGEESHVQHLQNWLRFQIINSNISTRNISPTDENQ